MRDAESPATLDGNLPGQSAMIEMLRLHDAAPARSPIARLFGMSPLTGESRAWYDAAVSEIEVGDALALLGDEWTVLHALPVGSGTSDIDHVAIGPGGVFIVNTKNHTGQSVWASGRAFLVSGIRHPYIRNMEYEMGRAERLIGSAAGVQVEVSGILAIVAAKSITVREKHRDVTVLATDDLVSWLLARPRTLEARDVDQIVRAAIRGTTWYQDDTAEDRSIRQAMEHRDGLHERFAVVRTEVRQAWRSQLVWATLMTIVGAGGFVLVTYSILVNAVAALAR